MVTETDKAQIRLIAIKSIPLPSCPLKRDEAIAGRVYMEKKLIEFLDARDKNQLRVSESNDNNPSCMYCMSDALY